MELFTAIHRYVPYSILKMRPIANVVRGKKVQFALDWLSTHSVGRAMPFKKLIASARANAENKRGPDAASDLMIKEIKVDVGPSRKRFKPGAMGRSNMHKTRFCHISVVLAQMTPDNKGI